MSLLETGGFAASAELPPAVVAAMTAMHEVVNVMAPFPPATLDAPLEPTGAPVPGAPVPGGPPAEMGPAADRAEVAPGTESLDSEDEVMDELDHIDEGNSEALLAAARRLKRARRR